MIINELLVDKYRVLKALDKEVDHSLPRFVDETHKRVSALSKTHGLSFKYGSPGKSTEKEELDKTINSDA